MVSEPINLRTWKKPRGSRHRGCLFTCGRPGRATFGRAKKAIDEKTIDLWVRGLPQAQVVHIVSLLGKKIKGLPEFSYYPFRSEHETDDKPSFQKWLDEHYSHRFIVHEFPTVDAQEIPDHMLEASTQRIRDLLCTANTVVVVDSAGVVRSRRVCEAMGYVPV